jgi:hypothetical protein
MSGLINRDLDTPLNEAQAKHLQRFEPALAKSRVLERFAAVEALTGDLTTAVSAAEDAYDGIKALEFHNTMPASVLANGVRFVRLVPPGVNGVVVSGLYEAAVAAASALGDISIELVQGDGDPVSDIEDIDGATSQVISGGGPFVNGLRAKIESDNADATAGSLLSVSVVYTITH